MYRFGCGHKYLFLRDKCPGVQLLGHMVGVCLVFKETAKLFQSSCTILHSTSNVWENQFLHILAHTWCCHYFFPVLLRYNWHITFYTFKVYNIMIWYCIHGKMITTMSFVNIHHLFIGQTTKVSSVYTVYYILYHLTYMWHLKYQININRDHICGCQRQGMEGRRIEWRW